MEQSEQPSKPLQVVGLSFSPRLEGNSDFLLHEVLKGAKQTGAEVEHIWVGGARVGPCTECNFCYSTGSCKFQDDFQPILHRILQADRLFISTPIFFAGIPAQAKQLIDRCQVYWVQKHKLGRPAPRSSHQHLAALLVVGNTAARESFVGIEQTISLFLSVLGFGYAQNLYVGQACDRGTMQACSEVSAAAESLGRTLCQTLDSNGSMPTKTSLFRCC